MIVLDMNVTGGKHLWCSYKQYCRTLGVNLFTALA